AVVTNIEACLHHKKNMVVGTTGWHGQLDRGRALVEKFGAGFLFGANFSIAVNLFFDTVRMAAEAAKHGYSGQIFERHHQQKKDAPSGTALVMQEIAKQQAGAEL